MPLSRSGRIGGKVLIKKRQLHIASLDIFAPPSICPAPLSSHFIPGGGMGRAAQGQKSGRGYREAAASVELRWSSERTVWRWACPGGGGGVAC
jgi:hypothetical protein